MKVFSIPIRLPGLNEYQNACRRHPLHGAAMKKQAIQQIMTYLTPVEKLSWPAQFEIVYTEPNKKRDIDNIMGFGAKVILDAFVKAGFLPDDGPNYINKIESTVVYDDSPKIEVFVKEQGDPTWADMSDINKLFDEAARAAEELNIPREPILQNNTKPTKKRSKK